MLNDGRIVGSSLVQPITAIHVALADVQFLIAEEVYENENKKGYFLNRKQFRKWFNLVNGLNPQARVQPIFQNLKDFNQ